MNPVELLRVREGKGGRGGRVGKARVEGASARGKKDWGRMSILIKVKLSQSLVGIRIESTRERKASGEAVRAKEKEKKSKRNAIKTQCRLKSALSNTDRLRRLNDRESTLHFIIIITEQRSFKYSYFKINDNFSDAE